ncbi:MAG: LytTR family transcriptional regulator [Polyangiaceae bacterium]|nr:LytTR family transcriptional regulator [Polyangiaceae bacterium]
MSTPATRIATRHRGETRYFEAADIVRFWASAKYTNFRLEGEEHVVDVSLTALERSLVALGFVRIHRSDLVRLSAIVALRETRGTVEVELGDGQRARVSRRHLPGLRASLEGRRP